jgi:hypothetical protein
MRSFNVQQYAKSFLQAGDVGHRAVGKLFEHRGDEHHAQSARLELRGVTAGVDAVGATDALLSGVGKFFQMCYKGWVMAVSYNALLGLLGRPARELSHRNRILWSCGCVADMGFAGSYDVTACRSHAQEWRRR